MLFRSRCFDDENGHGEAARMAIYQAEFGPEGEDSDSTTLADEMETRALSAACSALTDWLEEAANVSDGALRAASAAPNIDADERDDLRCLSHAPRALFRVALSRATTLTRAAQREHEPDPEPASQATLAHLLWPSGVADERQGARHDAGDDGGGTQLPVTAVIGAHAPSLSTPSGTRTTTATTTTSSCLACTRATAQSTPNPSALPAHASTAAVSSHTVDADVDGAPLME